MGDGTLKNFIFVCAGIVLVGLTWPLFDIYPSWVATGVAFCFGCLLGSLLEGKE